MAAIADTPAGTYVVRRSTTRPDELRVVVNVGGSNAPAATGNRPAQALGEHLVTTKELKVSVYNLGKGVSTLHVCVKHNGRYAPGKFDAIFLTFGKLLAAVAEMLPPNAPFTYAPARRSDANRLNAMAANVLSDYEMNTRRLPTFLSEQYRL